MKTKEVKTLIVTIEGTDRKRRELERALRTFIDSYKDKRGVHELKVKEINVQEIVNTIVK